MQQGGGEAVQHAGIDAAGDHRDDLRVAVITRARGRLPGPGSLGFGGAGQAAEPVQIHMQHDLRRLARPFRQAPRPGQPPAGVFEGVVQPLALGPLILRAAPLPQSIQHRRHRRGALRGQVRVQLPRALERRVQPQRPASEAVVAVGVGTGALPADLLGQLAQITKLGAAGRRAQQEHIRIPADVLGQLVGPVANLPRPRLGDLPGTQRIADRAVACQAVHPAQRTIRGAAGDAGLPLQPRPRRSLAIVFAPALGAERRQHPGPGRGVHRRCPFQPAQAVRLHGRRHRRDVGSGQPAQPGRHHRHRLGGGGRRGRHLTG